MSIRFYRTLAPYRYFEEALTSKALVLTVQFLVEGNRPFKDQTEAVFQLKSRDAAQASR